MSKRIHRGLSFPPLVLGGRRFALPDDAGDAAAEIPTVEAIDAVEALLEPAQTEELVLEQPRPRLEPLELELIEPEKRPKRAKPEKIKTLKPEKPAKPVKAQNSESEPPARIDQASAEPPASTGPMPIRMPFWARWAYAPALALAAIWTGTTLAFSDSYQNRYGYFEYRAFPVVQFVAVAVLPALFMLIGAYVLRQAARLGLETRRARALADELAIPAALAVDHAGGAADAVRREVARATEAGEAAERQLLSLRQALADESERLIAATGEAERSARALTESLSRERAEIGALAAGLDSRAEAINDAIARQTQMVANTSDLAAAQLQEAEAVLAARATDLASAAGEAGEAAELAGEALTRQAERLESVGELVGSRLQTLHDDLGRGHSRLADLAVRLQADQEALSERLEGQRIAAAETRAGVAAAADSAETVAATLRDLIAEADDRLRSVADAVRDEQAALDARARASLSMFRDAVVEERTAIEAEAQAGLERLTETAAAAREAAAASAEAARDQIEQLGEAAFAAGQRADQAFDAHIASARRAIEAAAELVAEAGQSAVGRIDAGLGAAREALNEITAMLASVDQRIAEAPAEARAQAEAVRLAVDAGLAEIAANARKIAADTETVDAALQDRVRKNYEMLSEALKTMGKVAAVTEQAAARSAGHQAAPLPTPRPAPVIAEPAPAAPRSAPTPAAAAFAERAIRVPSATPLSAAPPPELRPAALASTDIGLRPRLRLTPETELGPPREVAPVPTAPRTPPTTHESLEPFVRPTPRSEPAPHRETTAWTWKDLLSSIDEPPIDDEVLAERLISEIEALGLDAATLLPLPQIDAIAQAMQRGDLEAVREAVRGLAPSAVRRLSRRVLTDKVLRAQANRYVRRYEDLLNDSARRDNEGFMTAALLGSEPGRAFLLFDAAVGELH